MLKLFNPFKDQVINKSYYKLQEDLSQVLKKYASKKIIENGNTDALIDHPEFSKFLKHSPGLVAIVDFHTQAYVYLSENIENILGYKVDEFYEHGITKTISIFPVEQNEIIIHKIFPMMFEFFERHAENGNVHDIRVSITTKIIRSDKSVGWYLHQMQVLHTDTDNKPHFGYKLILDISDVKNNEAINFIVAEKDKNGIFKNIYSQTFNCENNLCDISEREKDVLALIGEGKNSKEIAELLFISEHTVYNHRKNMLKKMDVKSTGELLKKAIANGIL